MSSDGRWVIIRYYLHVRLYRRASGQRVSDALLGFYTTIKLAPEPQGEAIAFAPSSQSGATEYPIFYTASELGPKVLNPDQTMPPISRYSPSSTKLK